MSRWTLGDFDEMPKSRRPPIKKKFVVGVSALITLYLVSVCAVIFAIAYFFIKLGGAL